MPGAGEGQAGQWYGTEEIRVKATNDERHKLKEGNRPETGLGRWCEATDHLTVGIG
jgi:hypothetical protein